MIGKRISHRGHRQIVVSRWRNLRLFIRDFAHHTLYVVELGKRGPSFISLSPVEIGREPYRERFGEIFIRVLLCIPAEYVADVVVWERVGLVSLAIRPWVWPESHSPVGTIVQTIRIIERVTCLVTKEPHRLLVGLDSLGEIILDALETRISEIERDADQRRSVRASPLIAEINRWMKPKPFCIQLRVKLVDHALDPGSGDGQAKLGYLPGEEVLALAFPVWEWLGHQAAEGQGAYRVLTILYIEAADGYSQKRKAPIRGLVEQTGCLSTRPWWSCLRPVPGPAPRCMPRRSVALPSGLHGIWWFRSARRIRFCRAPSSLSSRWIRARALRGRRRTRHSRCQTRAYFQVVDFTRLAFNWPLAIDAICSEMTRSAETLAC